MVNLKGGSNWGVLSHYQRGKGGHVPKRNKGGKTFKRKDLFSKKHNLIRERKKKR